MLVLDDGVLLVNRALCGCTVYYLAREGSMLRRVHTGPWGRQIQIVLFIYANLTLSFDARISKSP